MKVLIGMIKQYIYLWLKIALAWLGAMCLGIVAQAQNFTVTGTAGDTIDASVACGTANLTKTITVSGITTIADLNFGLLANHTWRGDIQLDLTSPAPNSVTQTLITSDTSGTGADGNYNIELDDETAETVNTGVNDVAHDTALTPYQFIAGPNNPLSAFDADTSPNGDWIITICDAEPNFDDGAFLQATLFFEPTTGADLSLTASTANLSPTIASTISVTYEITNLGPEAAGSVSADISLPSGVSYVSQAGTGTYDELTGVWTLPATVGIGGTASITIDVYVEPIGPYNLTAEIISSDKSDSDSTPNNGSTTEDDDAALTLTPVPPATAPDLTCPLSDRFTHSWTGPGTTNGWTAGDLTGSYTAGGQSLDFTITGNTGSYIPYNGSNTPVTNTVLTGGLPAANGFFMLIDFPSSASTVTTTIDVGTPGTGVGDLQFSIYDVDFGAAAFVDEITVTGSLNGVTKYAVLTPGAANSISGTSVIGDGTSDLTSNAGNMTATFLGPVDQVSITYGNGPGAPTDPLQQGITIAPITMCPPSAADLSAVKTVEVYDPANAGLYMTPGNEVLYKITVNNSAAATADAEDIDLSDTLPDNVRFVSATTTGFTGGAFGSPALPAANTDCDSGACVIRYSGATLPINTTGEIEVRALIK